MIIKGKIVTLRAIEKEDLPHFKNWANDPEIQYLVGGWHFPTNTEDQAKWFDSLSIHSLNQRFAIDTKEQGLIGTATLVEINWKDRNAIEGLIMGDKEIRGKGYGTDTVMALMRYAFEELGLHRLATTIIEYNKASLHLHINKCGWKEEGRQKDWYFRKGNFWERVIIGITREDYDNLVKTNNYWND